MTRYTLHVGIGSRASLLIVVVAAACADTSNLSGGVDLPDASSPKPKDSGTTTPIGDDGGGPITPGGRCDASKPFGAPELVTEFDPQATTTKSAVLTPDELEVFYLRYVDNGMWDLRHARRGSKDAPWGAVATDAISPSPQGFLSLTAAGKKLYFWTIAHDYRASRSSTTESFGTPAEWDVASGPWPFVVAADDTAYFAVYGDGGNERFIRRGSVTSFGFSSPSSEVPNVHVAGAMDSRPVLNASETIMYFASNRPGGRGLDDVWTARRPTKQDEFGPGTHVRELSTDDPDYVTWVSDDDCFVMLDRASHVYQAKRPL